jgi:hypothetical protein
MGRSYSAEPATLKPAILSDAALLAIGRLVRATAEIEDMILLFICGLANITETQAFIMVGRTPVSRLVEIAGQLASIRPDAALKAHKLAFNDTYNDVVNCRNSVAHGSLLGEDENGRFYFQSSNQLPPVDLQIRRLVHSYSEDEIIRCGLIAEQLLPRLEQLLQVSDLREERLQQAMQPHPKGRKKRNAKPPPQPQS